MRAFNLTRMRPLGLALSLALAYPAAQSLPQGGQVVQGQVVLNPGLIQQASDKAIVNWQSFSIGAQEKLLIQQPGVNSVLLNRVVGGDPSLILGQLQANGRVFLVNPRGIVFGRGSQVNAGGLVASTLDLSDTDFLAGRYRFSAGTGAGALQADGRIDAPGGTVALLAPQLDVGGSIAANRVGLAAAPTVQVDVEGDGLVLFNLRNDDGRDVALKLSGSVQADGSAEARAQARAGAAGQVLNMDGLVQARGLSQRGGRIVIDGGTAGDTLVNGRLDASGEQGGAVTVLGQRVALLDAAVLDASGRLGGGSLQVGGGFEGRGTAHNAERSWVARGALLKADATEEGDGGRISLWADVRTDMFGRISARGGRLGGDGGFVETSGRQQLNLRGGVDVAAPRGRAGHWLLDPYDLRIANDPTDKVTPGSPFESNDVGAVLDATELSLALDGGATVTVQTGAGGAQAGNITVQADITPAGPATLNLIAHGSISFAGGGIDSLGNVLNVTLQAGGSITANVGTFLETGGGSFSATGTGNVVLRHVTSGNLSIGSGGGNVTLPTGSVSGTLTVNTGGGTLTQAAGGLTVSGISSLNAGSAAITLTQASNNFQAAVGLTGGATQITDANALVLGASSTGSLTVIAGGAITQTGALTATGAASLNAGANAITLTQANNDFQAAVALTGTTTQITDTNALNLGSLSTGNLTVNAGGALNLGQGSVGTLNATTSGAITQAGALTVTGAASLNAGSAAITLTQAANDFQAAVGLAGGVTQLTNANALTLGTLATGNLTVDAGGALDLGQGSVGTLNATATGAITQAGALTVTGAASLNAGAHAITLTQASNDFQAAVGLTGTTTQVTDTNALVLGASSTGALTVIAGGAISQTGAVTATGAASLNAGANAITLTQASNDFQAAVALTGTTTQITDTNALTLGSLSTGDLTVNAGAALNLGQGSVGALNATSTGAITQAGALTVAGAASLNAGSAAITLTQAANDFQAAVGLAGGVTQLTNANALTLGLLATGNLTINAGGALNLGQGSVGTLNATSSGAITQAGALTATGAATLNAGANAITLTQAANDFQAAVGLTGTTTQITDTNALVLGASSTGSLTVNAGGAITQAGALTAAGAASLNAGANAITLTQASNDFQAGATLTGTTTQITDTNALTLGTLSTGDLTVNAGAALTLGPGSVGALNATASGAITQAGALTVTGAASLNAGSAAITLTQAANDFQAAVTLAGGVTQLTDANALTLGMLATGNLTVNAGGALNLGQGSVGTLNATTTGAITQTGALTAIGAAVLNAGSAAITLTQAVNDFQSTVGLTGGATQLTNANALALGALSTGHLTINAGGAITQAAAMTVTGTAAFNSGGHAITLTQASNDFQGAVGLTGTTVQVTDTNALTLGTLATGNLTVNAGGALSLGQGSVAALGAASAGAITQAGALTVTGIATLDAGSAAITLTQAGNDFQSTVGLSGGVTQLTNGSALTLGLLATGNLTVNAGGALNLGQGSVGTLSATSTGALTQAGALTATGAATLNAGSAAITLTQAANDFQSSVGLSGGATQLTNANALLLGASSTGSLAVSAGGAITQAGALTATGAATFNSGGAAITLTQAGNDFQSSVGLTGGITQLTDTNALTLGSLATGDLTVNASGALNLGTGNIGGTLVAHSGGGHITQGSAGLNVTGAATLDAGTGNITLTSASNHWNGVTLSGDTLNLSSAGHLTLNGLTQPANRALTLLAAGNLNLGATTDIDTGSADLSLTSLGGSFSAAGRLNGANITLAALSGLTLGHDIGTTGTLSLTTGSGGISQTAGAITAGGITTLNAGASAINLTQAGNHFGAAVNVTSGAVSLADSGALTLGTLATTGDLALTSNGALNLGQGTVGGLLNANSGGHAITQAGALTLVGATSLNAGAAAITLAHASNDLQGAISATGGAVSLRSANNLHLFSLTQPANQALVLQAGAALTLPAGTGDIDTGSAALTLSSGGVFNTFGRLSGGTVTLRGQSATLAHDITAGVALDVQATAGAISQIGGRIVSAGPASFGAGASAITLSRALNDFQGNVSLSGGAAHIVDSNALTLTSLAVSSLQAQAGGALQLSAATLGGDLSATAGGAISQTGALQVGGSAAFNGTGGVTLLNATNSWTGPVSLSGGAVQLRSSGALALGAGNAASLALTTGGAVSQNAAITVGGALSVNSGSAAVTLAHAGNQLGGAVTLTSGAAEVRSAAGLTLGSLSTGALTARSGGALNLGQGSVGGNLVAQANGAVTQSGVLSVTGTADVQAGSGSITLNQGGNSWGGALSLGGGATEVRSNAGLTLGTLAVGALTVDATGALVLGQSTVGGALSANSHGGPISQTGALDVNGNAQLQSGAGSITLTQAGNRWRGRVDLTSGATQLIGSGALNLGTLATGNLSVATTGALGLGQGNVGGALDASSGGGNVAQAGALRVTGNTRVNAGSGDITLAHSGNQLLGTLDLIGNAVTLFNQPSLLLANLSFHSLDATSGGSITLGSGSLGGTLTARALGGGITQTGGGITVGGATTLQAAGPITLTAAANRLQGPVSLSGGNTALANAGALTLGTVAVADLTLNVSGALTQTSPLSVTGITRLDAGSAAITLDHAANAFGGPVQLRGGNTRLTSAGALTLGRVAVADLTVQSSGALQLGTGSVGGALTARSGGTAIGQAGGGLRVAGPTRLEAGSAAITLLDAGNDFSGAVSLQGGASQLRTGAALVLGDVDVASLALTSGGAVSQTAALRVAGTLDLNAGSAAIALGQAGNALGGVVTLSGGDTRIASAGPLTLGMLATGALTATSAGPLDLGQGRIDGALDADSGGAAIRQTGALDVAAAASLRAGGAAITLTQAGNRWGGPVSLAGGATQIHSAGALALGTLAVASLEVDAHGALDLGRGSIGGPLRADSRGGAITQAGALDVAGRARLQAGGGSITLADAGNRWGAVVDLAGGATRLVGSGALTLGSLATADLDVSASAALDLGQGSIAGDLAARSGGAITQAGALHVTGSAAIDAGGADITLAQAGNRFIGALTLSGGAATVVNQPSLLLGPVAVQTLDATSAGGIAQTAGGLVVAGATTLRAAGDITLDDAANRLQGLVSLSGANTALTNAADLRLATVAVADLTLAVSGALDLGTAMVGGGLRATSSGPLTQTGALSVAGTTRLDTGSAVITLAQPANQFGGSLSLRGGDTQLVAAGALTLADLQVGALTLSAGGALQLGTGSVSGALAAISGGAIGQAAGGLAVSGAASLDAGPHAIVLDDAANALAGPVSLRAGDATLANRIALRLGSFAVQDLTLTAGGDIDLGGGSASGQLLASTQGTRIGQAAPLTVSGASTFVADGSLVDLVLDQPANQLLGGITLRGIHGGSFVGAHIGSAGDLSFTGDVQTLVLSSGGLLTLGGGQSNTLTAAAVRGIVQTGALSVSGLTTLIADGAALPVDLGHAGNDFNTVLLQARPGAGMGSVQLRDGDAARGDGLRIGGDAARLAITSAGALDLTGGRHASLRAATSGAAITQSGALDVVGPAELLAGSGRITLADAANQWRGPVQVEGGDTRIASAGALVFSTLDTGDLAVTTGGALDLGQGRIGGALTATSRGAITQSGALQVTGLATLDAGGADITLADAGNRFIGALTLSGGTATVVNQADLVFGALGMRTLDATSGGSVQLGSGSLGGTLAVRALGGGITQSAGGIAVAGTSTLQAAGGIALADAANQLQGAVTLSGADTQLVNAGALHLGGARITGDLQLRSGGALTQAGALAVTGSTSLDAGSAAITLDHAGNALAGPVSLRGGDTRLSNVGALTLASLDVRDLTLQSSSALQIGAGTVGGALEARSGGAAITQAAGGLVVAGSTRLDAGAAAITLTEATNDFAGPVSLTGGDARLNSAGALRLGSFAVQDLTLVAGGDIDLGSGTASGGLAATTRGSRITQAGALGVGGAASFVADGGRVSLVLDHASNALLGAVTLGSLRGGSFVAADITSLMDLSFSGDVQALNLRSGGLLTLGGGQSTTLTATATTGVVQTGALQVSGLATLVAEGAAMNVDLGHAGNDFHTVALQGGMGAVRLRDVGGLRAGGDAASLALTSTGAVDLAGGRHGSLAVDSGGAAITQSGALQVGGLTTLNAVSGDITLDRADNRLARLAIASAGTATLVSAGDYRVEASQVATRLDLGGPGAIDLAGPLSGSAELVMSGTGNLTVGTAQAHTGGTHIRAGRLVLQGPAATLGSGDLRLGAAGVLDLRDGAVLTNALLAEGGQVSNSAGSGTLAGAVTLRADTTLLPAAAAAGLTISGNIDGSGTGLRLGSAGTLTLAGSNDYSGTTDIAAGTLRATGAGSLSSASAIRLADGAVLGLGLDQAAGSLSGAGRVELGSFHLTTGADGRDTGFSGSLAGSGGLTKVGSGRFTLAGNGAHTGATTVAAGELVLASATALNDVTAVTVDGGATLTVQQSLTLGSLAGAGVVDVQAALLGVGSNDSSTRWAGDVTGRGGLAKRGAGVFTLAGRNTLAGDLAVGAGTLQLEGSGVRPLATAVVGPVVPTTAGIDVAGGATLALGTDLDLGALTGAGQVQLDAHTLTLGASGRSGRFDGVVAGSGGLAKAGSGTLTLGGANLYTGGTRVEGGTLVLDAAQALAGASALVIEAPAQVRANAQQAVASLSGDGALVLNGASLAAGSDGRDSRFDGAVSGSGGLVKQGAGTLTLTATHRNSGATVIEAGAVRLAGSGSLGSGEIRNDGQLVLARSDALTLDQAVSGRGSLVVTQGQVTLANAANSYSGATQVLGGSLITTAAQRLPDATAVQVAAGAQLQLGGAETIASLQAAGSVRLAGDLTTRAEQVYTGSLTLASGAGLTLSGTLIDAAASRNDFGSAPLRLNGGQALIKVDGALQLGDVSLSNGGRIEAARLGLDGKLQLGGGNLVLQAQATPDDARATPQGSLQVPVAGLPLALAEATVQQGAAGVITLAEGASLQVVASGGGSVLLAQDANDFRGQLSVLSGSGFNTAWLPNAKGAHAVQSMVRVSGQQVRVGGSGIEADLVHIRADRLATSGDAKLVARLPFDDIVLGRALSAPGMTLELAPGAFGLPGSFGAVNGQAIQIEVGSTDTGARTSGPNAGYLTVLPKGGAQGSTAVVLVGPKVGSALVVGGPVYRFFHDGASQPTEIPVVYNGVLPLTPAASGAISSINGDAEDARRARFQETVRTENVTVRLRSGVIAEVGPGRPSTQGSEGAKPPEQCDPSSQLLLSCK